MKNFLKSIEGVTIGAISAAFVIPCLLFSLFVFSAQKNDNETKARVYWETTQTRIKSLLEKEHRHYDLIVDSWCDSDRSIASSPSSLLACFSNGGNQVVVGKSRKQFDALRWEPQSFAKLDDKKNFKIGFRLSESSPYYRRYVLVSRSSKDGGWVAGIFDMLELSNDLIVAAQNGDEAWQISVLDEAGDLVSGTNTNKFNVLFGTNDRDQIINQSVAKELYFNVAGNLFLVQYSSLEDYSFAEGSRIVLLVFCSLVMLVCAFMAIHIVRNQVTEPIQSLVQSAVSGTARLNTPGSTIELDVPVIEDSVTDVRHLRDSLTQLIRAIQDREKDLAQAHKDLVSSREQVAVGRTVQMLAHDVRKPFKMIEGFLTTIESESDLNTILKKAKKYRFELDDELRQINEMLDDIMRAGKLSQQNIVRVNVRAEIDLALRKIFRFRPDADIVIETNINEQLFLPTDRRDMERTLHNILLNACEAMNWTGKIWLNVDRTVDNKLEFVLGNSGSYIPGHLQSKIFEYFHTSKSWGNGIGLAIVKQLIEANHGSIYCRSSAETGTEFVIRFPGEHVEFEGPGEVSSRHCRTFLEQSFHIGESLNSGLANIIFVDDNLVFRDVWKSHFGDQIQTFASPQQFLRHINASNVNVPEEIFLDMDLGEGSMMTGLDLAKTLRDMGRSKKIYLATNSDIDLETCEGLIDGKRPKLPG